MGNVSRAPGRRVFFVYPPSVIEDQMIQFLVSAQIETAVIKDHEKIPAIIRAYPNAILYFDIESHLKEPEWERVIRTVLAGQSEHGADVGIVSYNEDPGLARKYLMDIGTRAGYIHLKLGFEQSARIMLKALEAVEARGNRRFVRAAVPPGKGTLNIRLYDRTYEGELIDVSVAGIACRIERNLEKGEYLADMQLRLWGSLVTLPGKVFGIRDTPEGPIHVIMFDDPLPPAPRGKIMSFLRKVMQWEVDSI